MPSRSLARLIVLLALFGGVSCDRPASVGDALGPTTSDAPAPVAADGGETLPAESALAEVASRPPGTPDWERLELVAPRMSAATDAFRAEDWVRAATEFEAAAAELDGAAGLAGITDQNHYNAACALALAGRSEAALDALETSLAHGFRLVPTRLPDGRTLWHPGLSPSHVLVDPDLDPLHDQPRWEALIARRFEAEHLVVEPAEATDEPRPALLVLASVGATAEASLPPWRIALRGTEVVLAGLEGPVRVGDGERDGAGAWVLSDGDERWGSAAILRAVETLAARPDVDASAIHVVAHEATGARAGWAATLERPGAFAGVAFLGAPFHRHAHQDALVRLREARGDRPPLVALLLPGRDVLESQLTDADIVVRRMEPGDGVEETARRITDGLGLTSR